jgi:uncharacterized membrane protein YqgA involved in biofilm formation
LIGTLLNIATVIVGGGLGTWLGDRLPAPIRETVMHGIGLVTLVVGVHLTLETRNILIVLLSVVLGGILGEWWGIAAALDRASQWVQGRAAGLLGVGRLGYFSEGLVTASLVFCVGPMTILGAIQDGLSGNIELLSIKSVLDGFTAMALASTLGVGVLFSVITLLLYQGGITMLAGVAERALSEAMIAEMTATGGVLILAIGLLLLEIKRTRVANLLPALLLAPLLVALLDALGIPLAP